jgi:hypothetical protein
MLQIVELQRAWLRSTSYATEFQPAFIERVNSGEINDLAVTK